MPLPGGPSDKAGNSYERRWTVCALDLLGGRAQTLRIEVPGDEAWAPSSGSWSPALPSGTRPSGSAPPDRGR